MSDGSAKITRLWGDAEHEFRLAIGQLRELQDKTNSGPPTIFQRLLMKTWFVDDIRETIRLGLIGGGMKPLDALALVINYVDNRPLMENVDAAIEILGAALVGVPDDQPSLGKESPENNTQAESSSSPSLSDLERSLGLHLNPLTA